MDLSTGKVIVGTFARLLFCGKDEMMSLSMVIFLK